MSSKQREALEKCVRRLDAITPYLPLEFRKYVFADIQEAKAALAEPLKNCEVGTAKAQNDRHFRFCSNAVAECRGGSNYDCITCFSRWAQRPYRKEKK